MTIELKEEIKKLKEQRRLLNKKLTIMTGRLHDYRSMYNHMCCILEDYEKIVPNKYYKITYRVLHFINGETNKTELLKSFHPDALIWSLRRKHKGQGYLELIDILEVAS